MILLRHCHPDAEVHAYEGEGTGLAIEEPCGKFRWIEAQDNTREDTYTEGFPREVRGEYVTKLPDRDVR